jgi:copper(I)-binding protein
VIAAPDIKRRIGIGLVAACTTLLTAACATGQQAATSNVVPAVDATSGTLGDLQLRAVAIKPPPDGPSYAAGAAAQLQLVIVNTGQKSDSLQNVSSPAASGSQVFATSEEASAAASPSASGTASDSSSPSGSTSASARSSPSGSTSASASSSPSGSTSASASPSASSSAATPPAPVSLEALPNQALSLSINATDPVLLLRLNKVLFPGTTISVTFTFTNNGSVTLDVPVQVTENTSAGLTILPPSSTGAA